MSGGGCFRRVKKRRLIARAVGCQGGEEDAADGGALGRLGTGRTDTGICILSREYNMGPCAVDIERPKFKS